MHIYLHIHAFQLFLKVNMKISFQKLSFFEELIPFIGIHFRIFSIE